MSLRKTMFAVVLVGASIPAAFASNGGKFLSEERGFEFQPTTQSTKSRAEVMKETQAARKAGTLNNQETGYTFEQHSLAPSQGGMVHTDKLAHNTPKPSLTTTAAEQRLLQELNRN